MELDYRSSDNAWFKVTVSEDICDREGEHPGDWSSEHELFANVVRTSICHDENLNWNLSCGKNRWI
jgi:hypothetical protein